MPRADLASLIQWCRACKHGLDIGLSPVKLFRQQAKSGPPALRSVAGQIADRLEKGESIADALAECGSLFPPLVHEIVGMSERAGRLPDAFGELEKHYEAVRTARKQFMTAITWPAISYFLAIGVIALLVFILGMLGQSNPIGFHLSGFSGAIVVLLLGFGVAAIAVIAYRTAMASDDIQAAVQSIALQIPGLAGCARAVALSRFTMAFHMLAESGMSVDKVLKSSLRATTNQSYGRIAETASKLVRKGDEVSEVLAPYGERLFPHDFMQVVQLGEETGNLAELMHKQSRYYAEEAAKKMAFLAKLAGGAVYSMVAVFIIVLIFKIFTGTVGASYQDAFNAVDDPQKWLQGAGR
ncbi:MAG: type II secretion system F family protein [Gemmataceae bacterium]